MANLTGIGRIGRDAETRFTPGGDAVTEVSLAFSYGKKDPNTNQKPTQWVKASIWGQRGESLRQYLLKGTLVYVVLDDVRIQAFAKQDGSQGVAMVGKVSTIEFASRPIDGGQPQQQRQAPPQRQPQQRPAQQAPAANLADMDDDIPFMRAGHGAAWRCI